MSVPTRCSAVSGLCVRGVGGVIASRAEPATSGCRCPCLRKGLDVPEPFDAVTPAAAGGSGFSPEAAAPPTVGVEEEFVLADRHSRSAVYRSLSVVCAARAHLGGPHAVP